LTTLALSGYSGSWYVFTNSLYLIYSSSTSSTQEELQVPYEVNLYQRDAEHRAPKELKDAHFVGMSPVVTEGDFTLAESGAIVGEFKQRNLSLTSCLTCLDRILAEAAW